MTDDVASLVLRDNYLQGIALSLAEAQGSERIESEARLIRDLERAQKLDRAVEFLPSDDALAARAQAGQPLTRPELSVLLAYVKNSLVDELIDSDFPDDPQLEEDLFAYFPAPMVARFSAAIAAHRLRRDLIATVAANDLVNRTGISFAHEVSARVGRNPGDVARAYMILRQVFELDALWTDINALDNKVEAKVQLELLQTVLRLVERVSAWFLTSAKLDIRAQAAAFKPGIALLSERVSEILPETHKAELTRRANAFADKGVPAPLALRVARLDFLLSAVDIVRLAKAAGIDVIEAGKRFFAIGARFKLDALRLAARKLPTETQWQKLAVSALIEELYAEQAELTTRTVAHNGEDFEARIAAHASELKRIENLVREIDAAAHPDLAMLTVANRALRGFLVD
jgi:glutamate dehydrogenase